MALTRKMLKAMGIGDEQIEQIIEAHSETVEALKQERDGFKEDAEKLPEVLGELDELKAKPGDGFKEKYEREHEEFKAFKEQVEADRAKAEKSSLYRKALQEAGVDSKRVDAVMKVADLDSLEVEEGALKDHDKVVEGIKSEWGDFIPQTGSKPATVHTPPANSKADPEPGSLAEALRQKYNV